MGRPKIHQFEDTGEAYDASQSRDEIKDGDVLAAGRTVGVLVKAWPVAVVGPRGEFHTLEAGLSWDEFEEGRYAKSAQIAREYAKDNGFSGITDYFDLRSGKYWAGIAVGAVAALVWKGARS